MDSGRKKISDRDPDRVALLLDTFQATGDQRLAASAARMTTRTARKYLHEAGIWPRRGKPPGRFYLRTYNSDYVQWMKAHPEIDLRGKGLDELVALSGCPRQHVREYYERLEKALTRELETLPPLGNLPGAIKDTTGVNIPFRAFDTYKISSKGYSRFLTIEASLKTGGDRTFHLHLDSLWAFINGKTLEEVHRRHQKGKTRSH